ncbi:hypothetical protein Acr_00g0040930 [Actinidia rufa]|uniref:Uncharacterized protein n=1 Tax=Actinidia rufa TaxID=165716 RepID=A0A7J0DJR1_9ERIC|nr:hypothetical protein Acr_00g0040930 [Actinidia rufa]
MLGLSVIDYFGYFQTRWEELAHYEPLSDFTSDGAADSKSLDRRHTYQFLKHLKPEFEALQTQILNTSPLPSLYEVFTTVDGDEQRHHLLPSLSLSESSPTILDQMTLVTPLRTRTYCQHRRRSSHPIDRCFDLHPELKPQFSQNCSGCRMGSHGIDWDQGTPRTGAIIEVEPMHADSLDFNQLQIQIAQL